MAENQPIFTKSFINIFVSNFFVFGVFYALLTLMPIYVLDALEGTAVEAGLVVTVFLLSVILLRPFSGLLLDKFGKKRMLLLSMFVFGLTLFLYMFVESTEMLLVLRFFHGLSFSIATTVTGALAADVIPAQRRGEGIGYFGMSMNIAVVAGPFIALTLQPLIDYRWIFMIFGIIMLVGWVCALFVEEQLKPAAARTKRTITFRDLIETRSLPVSTVALFIAFAYSSIIAFISVYAQSLGLIKTASFFFLVYAVAMLLVRPFTGRLFDKMGPDVVIIPSLAIFALGLFSLSFTQTWWMLLLSGILIGLGYGTLLPSFQTLAVQAADKTRSAYATATFFMFFDTGIAIGSMVLGTAAGFLGYGKLYFALGVFVLLIVILYKLVLGKRQGQEHLA